MLLLNFGVFSQSFPGQAIDASTKQGIPYVKLIHTESGTSAVAGPKGYFEVMEPGEYKLKHPQYHERPFYVLSTDTAFFELQPLAVVEFNEQQLKNGSAILDLFQEYAQDVKTTKFPGFEFLSYSTFKVYEQSPDEPDRWDFLNSLKSIEKNRFKYPDKKYARVVRSEYNDGDTASLGFVPINSYTVSEENEYISILNLKYYNPLFPGADKRYDFALLDSFYVSDDIVRAIFFMPKNNKHFIGLKGVIYFFGERAELWGVYWMPNRELRQSFTIAYYNDLSSRNTRYLRELNIVMRLKNIPNISRNSLIYYNTVNTSPSFETNNTSSTKWINMALFDSKKDTVKDDTWMMRQIVDKEKLEYIKKDTSEKKFVLSNTLRLLYNIYEDKMAYRMRYFDINNVFAINKFESVRLGFGLQSHENLSDVFTFGGYFGYGIGDGKFKYGANVGAYFGHSRHNLISFRITKDLLEPGLVNYLDKRQDLVRNFFTSRMDDYQSTEVSLRTRISAYFTSSLVFNNFSLRPLYEYTYNPDQREIVETQTFRFTESTILFNIGTPFSDNPNLRNVIYRKKRVRSNLFLNITKGWDTEFAGEYDYWKFNTRLTSNIRLKGRSNFDIVFDAGVMNNDQPYQINYGGPGTEFKLTGIIINNAFQSMELYGFFADRYVHTFMNYNMGKVLVNHSNFKPELAFALNVGWGKITGRKEIHEGIRVADYSSGYYEAGVLLNNLLRLKIYNYFYGGLGIGTFYGFGPDAEDGAFAIRISYEIGTL